MSTSGHILQGLLCVCVGRGSHLYVSAVVSPGGQLDAPERDGTLQGHFDGRLLHSVLPVQPRGARDGPAAEVPLD